MADAVPLLLPSPPASFDAKPLLHLLAANTQDVLDGIVVDTFRLRHSQLSPLVQPHNTAHGAARHTRRAGRTHRSLPALLSVTCGVQTAKQWQVALGRSEVEVQQVCVRSTTPHRIQRAPTMSIYHLSPHSHLLSCLSACVDGLQLFVSLSALLRVCVYHSSLTSKSAIASLFPPSFHPALVSLLSKLLLSHLPAFRSSAASSLPSPAQLLSLSTAVHIRCSSSDLAHLQAPTIMLTLRLQRPASRLGEVAGEELVWCELKQEALNTILGGLNKIQEQLSGMQ